VGFTATSFPSVSLSPPLVSFCLDRSSSSWPTVAHVGHVGVHLLAHPQQGLARTFATSGIDRFASPTVWRAGPHGVPILAGTLAWLICRVVDWVMVGDRALLVAEPLLGQQGDEGSPLLYHAGRYAGLAAPADPASRSRDAA
jgi:flavin reductase (DIM6/NTAB) family NADH-FMN oxidoreductase RutF